MHIEKSAIKMVKVGHYMIYIGKNQQYCQPNGPTTSIFLWDMNNAKWCNGLYIQFRQSFAKETFSYDEHLKS